MKNIRKIILSIIAIFLLCIIVGCTSSECTNHYDDDNNGYCDNCNYQMSIKVNCPHCNAINDNSSKYCYSCGKETNLTKQCTNCNTELDINIIYCTKCGTNVCNHKWIDATCTIPKTCIICNVKEGSILEHTSGDWIIDKNATYVEDGSKHKECIVCHIVLETATIPMLKHNYQSAVTNPTCTEQGYTTYTCIDCGNEYIDDYVKALDHDLEHHEGLNPTCENKGYESYDTCNRCAYTTYQEIEVLNHKWNTPLFTWHEYNSSNVSFTCLNNSEHIETFNARITSEIVEEATCIKEGTKTYTATISFNNNTYIDTITETLPIIDHIYVDSKCTMCGKDEPIDDLYTKYGDYIYFGSYPQSEVIDATITNELTTLSGTLPTSTNSYNWTSYGYYIEGNISNYMWYQDVEYNNELYRGVYFTNYRTSWIGVSSSSGNSEQDDNGYNTNNIYWFKYEPIKWRILTEESGKALILCEMIIDSQEYYHSTSNRTIDGKTIYANNYEHSNIRKWLNDNFYNTAFNDLQKEIIELTLVDNSSETTGDTSNPYTCNNTNDKVFLLSYQDVINSEYGFDTDRYEYDPMRRKKTTQYAQCQGAGTVSNLSYKGKGDWLLRSPGDYSSKYVRGVSNLGGDSGGGGEYTSVGVVPALWISMDNTHEHTWSEPEFTWEGYTFSNVTFTCLNNSSHMVIFSHMVTFNAIITSEIVEEATCIEEGTKTYTATVEFNGSIYTDIKEETLPKADHNVENGKCISCDLIIYNRTGENNEYILFGSYPQSEVTDTTITNELITLSGTLPTQINNQNWTSYGYYIEGNISNYMWYQDIEYNNELYRGVYFTSCRPYYTTISILSSNTEQDVNGYNTNNIYWFKYEPLKWRILTEENGKALILCEMIIDSQEYYHENNSRTINGEIIYPNNYEYSNIRKWLNDNFYNTAFNDLQKEIIELTEVDNSASTTGDTTNPYTCNNTNDKVFLLSYQDAINSEYGFDSYYSGYDPMRQKQTTQYAQCQGAVTNTISSYYGNGDWWMRSPHYGNDSSVRGVGIVGYVGIGNNVKYTHRGVVPALWISL